MEQVSFSNVIQQCLGSGVVVRRLTHIPDFEGSTLIVYSYFRNHLWYWFLFILIWWIVDMMSVFKTDKRLFMVGSWWMKNSCTLFLITTSSKPSTGLYCPRLEPCGDESVPVSHSSFRTRKKVLLLTQIAWWVCWIYDELSRPVCFSKYFETLAMRNLSLDFKCFKDLSVDNTVHN